MHTKNVINDYKTEDIIYTVSGIFNPKFRSDGSYEINRLFK